MINTAITPIISPTQNTTSGACICQRPTHGPTSGAANGARSVTPVKTAKQISKELMSALGIDFASNSMCGISPCYQPESVTEKPAISVTALLGIWLLLRLFIRVSRGQHCRKDNVRINVGSNFPLFSCHRRKQTAASGGHHCRQRRN